MYKVGIKLNKILQIGMLMCISSLYLYALDVPSYYALDIKTMEVSLKGAKAHLKCLQNSCPKEEENALYMKVQNEISSLYEKEGITASKHIGFYTKHSKEAKTYYENNTTLQEKYTTLMRETEAIVVEIDALKKAKK